jgi:hypothetical protein
MLLSWVGRASSPKRADAPYRSNRNEAWLKIKTVQRGQFPVIGFVKMTNGSRKETILWACYLQCRCHSRLFSPALPTVTVAGSTCLS